MNYPPELAAHLECQVTTVCRCWRLTRMDGAVTGFTDHDSRLEVDGTSYEPQSGFSASEAKRSLGLSADAVDVSGALSSASITEEEIEAGMLDGASVETLLVNWREPSQFVCTARAIVGKITRRDGQFIAELESRMRFLDQPNGRYVLRRCDAELGDVRCGVALPGFTASGTILSVDVAGTAVVGGLDGFSGGWFASGVATFASGACAGRPLRVSQHRNSGGHVLLTFTIEGRERPAEGDEFSVVAGCDKSFATCKAKFSNPGNFRGFPHLPGNDQAYAYPREDAVFDGGPVVP